jgi:signal transduction histidine kinase
VAAADTKRTNRDTEDVDNRQDGMRDMPRFAPRALGDLCECRIPGAHDRSASSRAELLLGIREAVLAMTERIDSLLQFGSSRRSPPVHGRVSLVVEKAVAAVKLHPDGRNVSITVGEFPPAEADIDERNLEGAIYNLLLNACQAAMRSLHVPGVKVHLREVDERI